VGLAACDLSGARSVVRRSDEEKAIRTMRPAIAQVADVLGANIPRVPLYLDSDLGGDQRAVQISDQIDALITRLANYFRVTESQSIEQASNDQLEFVAF